MRGGRLFGCLAGACTCAWAIAACTSSDPAPGDDSSVADAAGAADGGDVGDGGASDGSGGDAADAPAGDTDADADAVADADAGDPDPLGAPSSPIAWSGSYDLPADGVCSIHGWCGPFVNGLKYVWGASWSSPFAGDRDIWAAGTAYPFGGDAILHFHNGKLHGLTGLPSTYVGPISGSGPNDVWIGKLRWNGASIAVNPKPPPGTAPWFAAANDAWSVGTSTWHWDGADWTAFASGTVKTLTAVFGFASNDVWAVGSTALRHWTGTAWVDPTVPMPAGAIGNVLGGFSSTNLWVGGGPYAYRFNGAVWTTYPVNGDVVAIGGTPSKTRIVTTKNLYVWDGATFQVETLEDVCTRCTQCNGAWTSPTNGDMVIATNLLSPSNNCGSAMYVRTPGNDYFLGAAGSPPYLPTAPIFEAQNAAYALVDGKPNWGPALWGLTNLDHADEISGSSANDVWVSGTSSGGGVASHWNGAAFTAYELADPATSAVAVASPTAAWVLTKNTAGNATTAFFDGVAWTAKPGPAAGYAKTIWGSSATDAWGAGSSGCEHWDGMAWAPSACALSNVQKVWGTGSADVWFYAATGEVVHWNGAGFFAHGAAMPGAVLDSFSVSAWNDVWAVDVPAQQPPRIRRFNGSAWQSTETGIGFSAMLRRVSVTGGFGRAIGTPSWGPFPNTLVMTRRP